MDISTQCLSVFKSFINDIIKVFPEYKIKLEDVYGTLLKMDECVLEEEELLQEFLERVNKLNKKITNKDETLFESDPLILTDISFKNIWTTNISYKTKETIWKYLQTFCLISLNYQSNKSLKDALSDLSENKNIELKDKKIASDVKKIKKMTENIQEPIPELPKESVPTENEIDNMGDTMSNLLQNTSIGKLAEHVTNELDFDSILGGIDSDNPIDILQKIMSGDTMSKIMGEVQNTMDKKVKSGELDENLMRDEATSIYSKLGNNEQFSKMTQDAQQAKQILEQQARQQQQQPRTPAQENNPHQSNKTKQRLQKKLKEKQKQKVQVNKVDQ